MRASPITRMSSVDPDQRVLSGQTCNKQMIYVAKKVFQTNVIEIKYNCAKRYHILRTNCAKGIVFRL